uniref:General transcription factor 3C polypeptide 5 n=1 Tax=Panagrellus redivivus TaxID=6233 RepID=A0A7E4V129_PANRE
MSFAHLFDKRRRAALEQPAYQIIYHPMIIQDEKKALESIGGLTGFNKTITDKRPLQLKLQPKNEYHAGIFNDRPKSGRNAVQLLMKFERNKRTGAVRTVCLGVVNVAYHFNSLADHQYIPIAQTSPDIDAMVDLVPKLAPRDLTDALCWWDRTAIEEEAGLCQFLPPFMFSRYTKAMNRMLTPEEIAPGANGEDAADPNDLVVLSRRPERKSLTWVVQGTEAFPEHPKPEAVEEVNARFRPAEPHDVLTRLFDERPMWTRPALLAETGLDDGLLKAILPKFAFYVLSGPFGRCWCRFGYDPRKDPAAKAYQTIAVAFRFNEHIPEKMRLKISGRTSHLPASAQNASKIFEYRFLSGVIPHARQMWYCVMDIKLPVAEEVLKTDLTSVVSECHPVNGWLPVEVVETLRDTIKNDVAQTMSVIREAESDEIPADASYYDPAIDDIF